MVAPSFIAASTGNTDIGGAFTATSHAPGAAERIIILQILQDGSTSGAVTFTSATNIKTLAGTSNQWTTVATDQPVGSPTSALQHIYIGRSTGTSAPTFTGGNSTSEDVYWRFYEFTNASPGTTLNAVVENWYALSYVSEINDGFDSLSGITDDGTYLYVMEGGATHRLNKRLASDLSYVSHIGGISGSGNDQFTSPQGIATDGTYLWIADSLNHRIVKRLASDLSYVSQIGSNGTGNDQFDRPRDVIVSGTHIYIADILNNRIVKRLASDLSYVSQIGTVGSGNDQFNSPTGLATDGTYLYVMDAGNSRIVKRLASDLSYVSSASVSGNHRGIDTDGTYLYLANNGDSYISKYLASDLSYVSQIGSLGSGKNQFTYPWDVRAGSGGTYVYVTDQGNSRIVKLLSAFANVISGPYGTDGTIQDAMVATKNPDRLALNFVTINDDNAVSAFTGMTGGTWAEAIAEYADAGGTDGMIQLQTALMTTAGTIDGGTTSNIDATDAWGVIGFALIGTTADPVFAQAQAFIVNTKKSAQAQAQIKAFGVNGYAQAQVYIRPRVGLAQVQASIIDTKKSAQAAGLINGTYFMPFSDTFTRTVSNGLGISNNGDTWVFAYGQTDAASVNGSQATFSINASYWVIYDLKKTLIRSNSGYEISFNVSLDKLPTVGELLWVHAGIANGSDDASSVYGPKIAFDSTKITGWYSNGMQGFGSNQFFTYTVNDQYTYKMQLLKASGTYITQVRSKLWKVGTSEPGWYIWADQPAVPLTIGFIRIALLAPATNAPFTVTLDNLQILEAGLTYYAQAQAKIFTGTPPQSGQAQASIKAFGVKGYAQALADIKATSTNYSTPYAQSRASIKAITNTFAQAQTDIKTKYISPAQAQAQIKTTYISPAQAQAKIQASYTTYAQAQAMLYIPQVSSPQTDLQNTGWEGVVI